MSIDDMEQIRRPAATSEPLPSGASALANNASRLARLRPKLGKFAAGALILLPAASVGAAVASNIAEAPSAINTGISGVEIDAKPQLADFLGVNYGPTIGFPAAHSSLLGIDFSAELDVKKFDASGGNVSPEVAAAAIFEDPKRTIGPPVKSAFLRRGLEGLVGGLGAFGLLAAAGFRERRRREKQRQNDANKLELLSELTNSLHGIRPHLKPDTLARCLDEQSRLEEQAAEPRHKARAKLGALALSAAVLAGGGIATSHAYGNLHPDDSNRTVILPENSSDPLVKSLLADNPSLENAFITGDAGSLAKKGLFWFITYKQKKDELWQKSSRYFTSTALPKFRAEGGMAWQDNPDIIAFADVTDIHDSRPELKYFLPTVFEQLGVSFVVNTGDEMNFSHQLFLDNGAWQRFADTLPALGPDGQPVKALVVAGNHDNPDSSDAHKLTYKSDKGKSYHPLIPLDESDDYSASLDGLTFVGSPDLNRTNATGTKPATIEGQLANDAKQGKLLAKRACDIYDKTGQRPILLAHEQQASYAAIAKGCVMLAPSGHLHETLATRIFANPDGSLAYQQTLGSASGDGPNNAAVIYNYATKAGAIRVWLYDQASGQLADHYITVHIGPGRQPSIDSTALPAAARAVKPAASPSLNQFFASYDPSQLAQENKASEPAKRHLQAAPN